MRRLLCRLLGHTWILHCYQRTPWANWDRYHCERCAKVQTIDLSPSFPLLTAHRDRQRAREPKIDWMAE